MESFEDRYRFFKETFESFLKKQVLEDLKFNSDEKLFQATEYSLLSPGKRLRPVLVLSSFLAKEENFDSLQKNLESQSIPTLLQENPNFRNALLLASSIECIHTYSLVHDDLPAMDNDLLRRGIPTTHAKFGEATAILVGDSLNSFAFHLVGLVTNENNDSTLYPDLLRILHEGCGFPGMVSGQSLDMQLEKKELEWTEANLYSMHSGKTSALITSALLLGNRIRPDHKANENKWKKYGQQLGLLFQITDDILDVEGSEKNLGKTPNKDVQAGKITFTSMYGIPKAKTKAREIADRLFDLGKELDPSNPFFEEFPSVILKRNS